MINNIGTQLAEVFNYLNANPGVGIFLTGLFGITTILSGILSRRQSRRNAAANAEREAFKLFSDQVNDVIKHLNSDNPAIQGHGTNILILLKEEHPDVTSREHQMLVSVEKEFFGKHKPEKGTTNADAKVHHDSTRSKHTTA